MENKSSTCHMTSEQRLIDVNEALRMIVDSKVDNPFALIRGQGEIWKKAHDCAIDCVKNAPTVDAVEVVHGRWIPGEFEGEYTCSRCGMEYCEADPTERPYKYCPECGSKNE